MQRAPKPSWAGMLVGAGVGCHALTHAAVRLGLLDPSAQGLGNTADLGGTGCDCASLRFA